MLHVEWYHVCWPRLTAKRVEPVVSISWASCLWNISQVILTCTVFYTGKHLPYLIAKKLLTLLILLLLLFLLRNRKLFDTAGPPGLQGDTGATGRSVDTGATGARGVTGAPGNPGVPGLPGRSNTGRPWVAMATRTGRISWRAGICRSARHSRCSRCTS